MVFIVHYTIYYYLTFKCEINFNYCSSITINKTSKLFSVKFLHTLLILTYFFVSVN